MIQFNLLPDVKMDYVRSKHTKQRIFVIAFLVSVAAIALLVLMTIVVNVFQKNHLSGVSDDITKYSNQIKSIEDLEKVLTVQNQLVSLTCTSPDDFSKRSCLHDNKPVSSRLFVYLNKVVPTKVSISELAVDFDQSTIQFDGTATSLNLINKFVDTLKFTTYKDKNGADNSAFTGVVLSAFGKKEDTFNYTINLTFNKDIFNSQIKESLNVPKNEVTTRSTLDNPTKDLFKEQPKETDNLNQPIP